MKQGGHGGPWGQRQCWALYKRGSAPSYNPTFAPPGSFIFQPSLLLFYHSWSFSKNASLFSYAIRRRILDNIKMATSGMHSRQLRFTHLLGDGGNIVGCFHSCGNDLFSSWLKICVANIHLEFPAIGLGLDSSCPAPQRSHLSPAIQCLLWSSFNRELYSYCILFGSRTGWICLHEHHGSIYAGGYVRSQHPSDMVTSLLI